MQSRSDFDIKYNEYYNKLCLNTPTGPYSFSRENFAILKGDMSKRESSQKKGGVPPPKKIRQKLPKNLGKILNKKNDNINQGPEIINNKDNIKNLLDKKPISELDPKEFPEDIFDDDDGDDNGENIFDDDDGNDIIECANWRSSAHGGAVCRDGE